MILKRKLGVALILAAVLVCLSAAWAAAQNYPTERNDYIAYLKEHVDSTVMERWRGDEVSMATLEDISKYLNVFDYWSGMAAEGRRHKLTEKEQALLDAFKAKASEIQNAAFPILRQALTKIPLAELGKADVILHAEGARARTLVFTGGTKFIEGDTVRFFSDDLKQLLQRLRFDNARHEIADFNGSRTETLSLTSFADDELAIFNHTTGKYKLVK